MIILFSFQIWSKLQEKQQLKTAIFQHFGAFYRFGWKFARKMREEPVDLGARSFINIKNRVCQSLKSKRACALWQWSGNAGKCVFFRFWRFLFEILIKFKNKMRITFKMDAIFEKSMSKNMGVWGSPAEIFFSFPVWFQWQFSQFFRFVVSFLHKKWSN